MANIQEILKTSVYVAATKANLPSGTVGRIGYVTSENKLYAYVNSDWQEVASQSVIYATSLPATGFNGQICVLKGASSVDLYAWSDTAWVDLHESIKTRLTTVEGDIVSFGTRLDTAEGDIDGLESTVGGIETRVATAEGNISTLQTTVSGHTTSIGTLETNVSGLTTRVTEAEGDIDGLESDVSGLQTSVSTIESNYFDKNNVETTLTSTSDSKVPTSKAVATYIATQVSSTYRYKGSCEWAQLPTSDQQVGDVWNVTDAQGGYPAGTNYAWDGSSWDALAGITDLSAYQTKALSTTIAEATTVEGALTAINTKIDTKADDSEVVKTVNGEEPTNGNVNVTALFSPEDTGSDPIIYTEEGSGNVIIDPDNTTAGGIFLKSVFDVGTEISSGSKKLIVLESPEDEELEGGVFLDSVSENNRVVKKADLTSYVKTVNNVTPTDGNVALTKSDINLGNVDNTSDADKPVSTAQQAALDLKANADASNIAANKASWKTALGYIEASDLPEQSQVDWDETDETSPAFINNKPKISQSGSIIVVDASNEVKVGDVSYTGGKTLTFTSEALSQSLALQATPSQYAKFTCSSTSGVIEFTIVGFGGSNPMAQKEILSGTEYIAASVVNNSTITFTASAPCTVKVAYSYIA
jgi:hypothetical protein